MKKQILILMIIVCLFVGVTMAEIKDKDITDLKEKQIEIVNKILELQKYNERPILNFFGTEYEQGDNGRLFLQLIINSIVENNDDCVVNLYRPDLTAQIDSGLMNTTGYDGLHYYDFIIENTTGIYMATSYCFVEQLETAFNVSETQIINGTLISGNLTSLQEIDGDKVQIKESNITVNKSEIAFDINFSTSGIEFNILQRFELSIRSTINFDINDFIQVYIFNYSNNEFFQTVLNLSGTSKDNSVSTTLNLSDFISNDDKITFRFSDYNKTFFGDSVTVPDPLYRGLWRFEEGSGNNATDSTGNENHGIILGGSYNSSSGNNETGNFSFESSGSFPDLINVTDPNGYFTFGDSVQDFPFSVGAWVFMHDSTGFRIVTKRTDNTDIEYSFFVDGNDKLQLSLADDTNNVRIARLSGALTGLENTWVHLVGTYDGLTSSTGITLYVNGVISDLTTDNAGSYVAMHNKTKDLHIGALNTVSTANGLLDEVFIIAKELTQEEILSIIENGTNLNISTGGENKDIAQFDLIKLTVIHNGTPTQLASQEVHVKKSQTDTLETITGFVTPALLPATEMTVSLFGILIALWVAMIFLGEWKFPMLHFFSGFMGIFLGFLLVSSSIPLSIIIFAISILLFIRAVYNLKQ